MKRILIATLLINTSVLVFAQNPGAYVREINGTVELQASGAKEWTRASLNEQIMEGTTISTGFKSNAVIAVGNSKLTVQALTCITIETLINRNQTDTLNLNLNSGRIKVDVKPPAGGKASTTIKSPSATASVRGTVFDLDTATIRVHEGSVNFQQGSSDDKSGFTVNAGQSSRIDPKTGEAVNPLIVAEENLPLPRLPGEEDRNRARRRRPASPNDTLIL